MRLEMMDFLKFKWLDSGTFSALHDSSEFVMKPRNKISNCTLGKSLFKRFYRVVN